MNNFKLTNKKIYLGIIVFIIVFFLPTGVYLILNSVKNIDKDSNFIKFNINNTARANANIGFNKIRVYNTKLKTIEEMALEDYVCGVVAGEMPVSFEMEALKAQAVAARTFALTKIISNCNQAKGADICDSIHCQVYISKRDKIMAWGKDTGEENWNKIEQAVKSTEGMILSYDKKLVMNPQYFAVSSGKTEDYQSVFGSYIPYLVSVDSPGEEIAPKFETSKIIKYDDFVSLINSNFSDIKLTKTNLKSKIKISSRNSTGSVNELNIAGVKVKGTDFRKALSLNSTNFTISYGSSAVTIICKGYGHGVGMSQWGANVFAKNGYRYEDILKHYYTGVEIKNIKSIHVN